METKKSRKADLERKRGLFFSVGLLFAMTLVITAFEWRTQTGPLVDLTVDYTDELMLVEIPPTKHPEPPKPVVVQPIIKESEVEIEEEEIEVLIDPEIIEEFEPEIEIEEPEPEEAVDIIHYTAERMPEPVGGLGAFYQYVAKNLKYPNRARSGGVEGKVFIQFVVAKDGSLTDIQVLKGIGWGCDEAALKVMQSAPAWKPGKQRGVPVKVRMVIPIHFRLN